MYSILFASFFILISCNNPEKDVINKKQKKKTISTIGKQADLPKENIICNKFSINYSLEGDQLTIGLDTDLPDFTDIVISVSRIYYEKGDPKTAYSREYYKKSDKIKNWRQTHIINVSDKIFKEELQTQVDLMARLGESFEVAKINDDIEISFVIPINQKDQRFAKGNANLYGDIVRKDGLRVISKEQLVKKPLGSSQYLSIKPTTASYNTLRVGETYVISKETPLVPEIEPADTMGAISKTIKLSIRAQIKILEKRLKAGDPWYRVKAYSLLGEYLGEGWINSIALLGQNITIKN